MERSYYLNFNTLKHKRLGSFSTHLIILFHVINSKLYFNRNNFNIEKYIVVVDILYIEY